MSNDELTPTASTYFGVFLVALSGLLYELVLTRIFSATVWYHFAFLAVSLAMFGMTVGSLLVYLAPKFFSQTSTLPMMALSATGFAAFIPIAFLFHASVPIIFEGSYIFSAAGVFAIFATCIALAVPFVLSGICICLALTRFPSYVNKLYGCDLIGAAFACVVLAYELQHTDGPTTLLVASVLAAASSLCLSWSTRGIRAAALVVFVLVGTLCAANIWMLKAGASPLVRSLWIKGKLAQKPTWEKWNSFSDVRVFGDPRHPLRPMGWGLDPRTIGPDSAGQLYEDIDGNAATFITEFHGDPRPVSYLKFDVTNAVHYMRPRGSALVIGVGGGRDVLSAMILGQKEVTGVELNNNILDALTDVFGDFAGHLERYKGVQLVNDEGRSFVSRSSKLYDTIQISLIDTWAATASGAFSLAENSLYTTQAWEQLLNHLNPNGVLSVSRWYRNETPYEIYRTLSLAAATLRSEGATDPRAHLILFRKRSPADAEDVGLGTLLVSRQAFTAKDIALATELASRLGWEVTLTPNMASDANLAAVLDPAERERAFANSPMKLEPPTDDNPYFFQMARLSSFLSPAFWMDNGPNSIQLQGLATLAVLTSILTILLLVCVFMPLLLRRRAEKQALLPKQLSGFFLCIGFAFMFLEISLMEQLNVFLGHPVYGLTVVLFAMLVFSGLGSMLYAPVAKLLKSPASRIGSILIIAILTGLVSPVILQNYSGATTELRIGIAVSMLAPLAFVAGTAFPTGMDLAGDQSDDNKAWLWALNGAASVLGSVLAVLMSILLGISKAYWMACFCYALAAAAVFVFKTHSASPCDSTDR